MREPICPKCNDVAQFIQIQPADLINEISGMDEFGDFEIYTKDIENSGEPEYLCNACDDTLTEEEVKQAFYEMEL